MSTKREAFLGPSARLCCKTKPQMQAKPKRPKGKLGGEAEPQPHVLSLGRPGERPSRCQGDAPCWCLLLLYFSETTPGEGWEVDPEALGQ